MNPTSPFNRSIAALTSILITYGANAADGPELLVDGGFEGAVFAGCPNPCFTSCGFGIAPWSRGGFYTEDLVRNSDASPCNAFPVNPNGGQYFVSLQGSVCCECNNNGSVAQGVSLDVGRQYRLKVDLYLDAYDAIEVSCGGGTTVFDPTNTPTSAWTTVEWTFTAGEASSAVTLRSIGTPNAPGCLEADNAYVDNMSLRQMDATSGGGDDGGNSLMERCYSRVRAPNEAPFLADINDDGRIDLVTFDGANVLRVAINDGARLVDVQDIALPAYGHVQAVVDMDGDGYADFLFNTANFWDCGSNSVWVYWNTGNAVAPFSATLRTQLPLPPNDYCIQAHTIDFDGDGRRDVIVTSMPWVGWSPWRPSRTYRNLGGHEFAITSDFQWPRDLYNVSTADVDGDGRADFLSMLKSGWADGQWGVWLYRGNGDGTFVPPATSFVYERDRGGFTVHRKARGEAGVSVAIYPERDPQDTLLVGTWNPGRGNIDWQPLPVEAPWTARQSIDSDGDGREEILVATDATQGRLGVMMNDGAGWFAGKPTELIAVPGIEFVAAARSEIANARVYAAAVNGSRISVYRTRSTGDLNGDGIVDGEDLSVLLANWGSCAAPCPGDLHPDGVINGYDLAVLLAAWGPAAP